MSEFGTFSRQDHIDPPHAVHKRKSVCPEPRKCCDAIRTRTFEAKATSSQLEPVSRHQNSLSGNIHSIQRSNFESKQPGTFDLTSSAVPGRLLTDNRIILIGQASKV
jgi:hypothetical protein